MVEHDDGAGCRPADRGPHQLDAFVRVRPGGLAYLGPVENPFGYRECRDHQSVCAAAPCRIVLRNDVVAGAGDERGAALDRLAERAQRRANGIGMAGAAAGRRHGVERRLGPEQLAGDDRHPVRRADAPQARDEPGGRDLRQLAPNYRLGNARGSDLAGAALERRQGLELGDTVIFEQLAQRREDRFFATIAGGEPVRVGGVFERGAGKVER